MPEPEKEVEQHLTRSKSFKIEKVNAGRLFDAIEAYFGKGYNEIFATDIGDWVMELTNTEGKTYKFRGSLCADFDYEGTNLSDLVRDTVGMDDLYVFDGNCKPDMINKITLDYHRVTKIKSEQRPEGVNWEFITWDYTEHLIIDRETETLEHIQNIGTGCKVSRKYEIDAVDSFITNQKKDLKRKQEIGVEVAMRADLTRFCE